MDNKNYEKLNASNFADLSLESILAEFKAEEQVTDSSRDHAAAHSHSIVMEALGQTVGEAKISSALDFIEAVAEDSYFDTETKSCETAPSKEAPRSEDLFTEPYFSQPEEKSADYSPADIDDTVVFEKKTDNDETMIWTKTVAEEPKDGDYAPVGGYEQPEHQQEGHRPARDADFKERLIAPLIGLVA
ncbi:MAG: hypothetical protein EOM14_16475, partial [Clostridia bacterium]|nr:hypothetical protein [Clostridia bacterium]